MNKDDIIRMAREAGLGNVLGIIEGGALHRFAALIAAAKNAEHAEKLKNDIHSCGPTCTRYACVAVREAVEAEREACAEVAEDSDHVVAGKGYYDQLGDANATVRNIAAAIRARKDNT